MILYSINSEIRTRITFIVAILAVASVAGISRLLELLPFHIAVPSAFGLFGLYVWLFDRFVWRWPGVRSVHGVPDLNGEWEGTVRRIKPEVAAHDIPVTAVIQQTWTRIQVEVIGERTRSLVRSVSLDVEPMVRKSMIYIYDLRPRAESPEHNVRGEGCQELVLRDSNTLEGPYFSTHLRKGTMVLTRKHTSGAAK